MYKVYFDCCNKKQLIPNCIKEFNTKKEAFDFCENNSLYKETVNNCTFFITETGRFYIRNSMFVI